jgi:arylsulfatase A-like enzyme
MDRKTVLLCRFDKPPKEMKTRSQKIMIGTLLLAALTYATGTSAQPKSTSKKTNFVFILCDDMGYNDVGPYGATDIRTPNIDKLASGGLKFTSFYTPSPVCSPTRAGLLTGRYPKRLGIDHVFFPESFTGLSPDEVTIAEALKTQGYATGAIGKWHLGHHREYLPLQQGFDEYFGIPYSNDMQGVVYLRGNTVENFAVDQHYTTKTYTEESIKFINKHKDGPFFLYLAHSMPHVPLYASPAFEGKSKRGLYGDVIEEIDWSVGEVVKALSAAGVAENTLVVFTSDNGPWLIFDIEGGSAKPLRNGKGTTFEGGQRVPAIFYWPGTIKPGTENTDLALMFDIFPTFVKLSGATDYKFKNPIDGEDLSTVLTGKTKRKGDEFIYYYNGKIEAFRKGDWKIIFPATALPNQPVTADNAHDTLLFNLRTDIGEQQNVLKEKHDVVPGLLKALEAATNKLGKTPPPLVQRMPSDDSHIAKRKQRQGSK